MTLSQSLRVFGWLLWRDIRALKQDFVNNLIDASIIPSTMIIINGYIMPYLGLSSDYGSFMVASSMVMMCYMATTWNGANAVVMDLETDKTVSYELTLPLPSWLVFIKIALAIAINAAVINMLILPMGKLLLWNTFSLEHLSISKAILMYISVSIFLGFFALLPVAFVQGMRGFARYQWRFGSQLLFYSGFQFAWVTLYAASPTFSYISLANPLMYAFEGMHSAVLGQSGYLNFWLCLAAIWLFTLTFGFIVVRQFKKRLDCI